MKFHHIGLACNSIDQEYLEYLRLGYVHKSEPFIDYDQGVRGCFIDGGGPTIELLEDLPNSSTLSPWLKNSIKMYHIAYLVTDIDDAISELQNGCVVVRPPMKSVAFHNRRIAFLMMRNKQLIELIEE